MIIVKKCFILFDMFLFIKNKCVLPNLPSGVLQNNYILTQTQFFFCWYFVTHTGTFMYAMCIVHEHALWLFVHARTWNVESRFMLKGLSSSRSPKYKFRLIRQLYIINNFIICYIKVIYKLQFSSSYRCVLLNWIVTCSKYKNL